MARFLYSNFASQNLNKDNDVSPMSLSKIWGQCFTCLVGILFHLIRNAQTPVIFTIRWNVKLVKVSSVCPGFFFSKTLNTNILKKKKSRDKKIVKTVGGMTYCD